jgi:hypothetical protein
MKKTTTLIAILIFSAGWVKSQNMSILPPDEFYKQYKMHEYIQKFGMKSVLAGSPYETEEFITGDVITTNNIRYKGVPLRLNIYSDEMEFKNEDGSVLALAAPESVDSLIVGNEKYIYSPYASGNKILRGFFVVLAEGKLTLLKKKNVYLKPEEPAGAYKDAVPPTFVRKPDEFFFRILPAEAKKVTGKKDIAELLPDSPPALNEFLKKNKVRFNKAEDLIQIAHLYNSQ